MKFSYFPGCTMKGTATDYEASMRATLGHLGIELEELDDWNCCGASSGHMTNKAVDAGLGARNIGLVEKSGNNAVVTPCPACYLRLRHADHEMRHNPEQYGRKKYNPAFTINYLTNLLASDEMLAKIKAGIKHPLSGLKIAAYYGCLSQRPPKITGADNHEHPKNLDRIIEAVGATAVAWSHKTECCGGSLTVTRSDIVRGLISDIVNAAKRGGAEAIVTDCAMCQANLESRQADLARADSEFKPLPVYFATEILAAAMSEEGESKWAKGHLVEAGWLGDKLNELKAARQDKPQAE